ncbi:hypothetical protein PT974_01682 [Cladobotryum mycophilum]|uniref:Heterokaryon incompatibility domain-containing protein n=1 Tax=Cladobotryum mycophilum TaxID=491253 RepID=A0ABR0SW36_9HYPO
MHWCDEIDFEIVGTSARLPVLHRSGNEQPAIKIPQLRSQAGTCSFCKELLTISRYRLEYQSEYNHKNNTSIQTPFTEKEFEKASVSITIRAREEIKNWCFGHEGRQVRTIFSITISTPIRWTRLVFQRANSGGRVPVNNLTQDSTSHSDGYLTYAPPGCWSTVPDDEAEAKREPLVACLDKAMGRRRPLTIDFATVKSWMRECDHEHPYCGERFGVSGLSSLRLVDVRNACIVQFSNGIIPEYAALSYVWGSQQFLTLKRDNQSDLQMPGSLEQHPPPKTIQDALLVCQALNIDYLWVDSLCIIQDDEMDKIGVIDKMDVIYAGTVVTIIAAIGQNAHAGIAGVRDGTRNIEQHEMHIRGVQFIESVDSKQFRIQTHFEEPEWIRETPWAQRAWTFQEGLVSRRKLFFTSEQVYWSCREGLLSEDTVENIDLSVNIMFNEIRFDEQFSTLEYSHLAKSFAKRQLTLENDVSRSYTGIQNYLHRKWGGQKFSWGVPHGSFATCLMWEWQCYEGRRIRQGHHIFRQPNGAVIQCGFPSWSWMSWSEVPDGNGLMDCFGDEKHPCSPAFYVFDEAGDLCSVEVCDRRAVNVGSIKPLFANGNKDSADIELTQPIITALLPQWAQTDSSLRCRMLIFYTEVVSVKYNPADAKGTLSDYQLRSFSDTSPFSILVDQHMYKVNPDQVKLSNDLNLTEIDLVAVYAGKRQMTTRNPDPQYRIRCWPIVHRNGLKVRAGYKSTSISLSLWKTLPHRRWELVVIV